VDARQIQQALKDIGFPIVVDGNIGPGTKEKVRAFQWGWSFDFITPDGDAGPVTQDRLQKCLAKGGKCSPNFAFREFASHGNGDIKVNRILVVGLQRLREKMGPINIISAYRDPAYNASVGGKSNSIHQFGGACDLHGPDEQTVRDLKMFSGIGIAYEGYVAHVDVRGQDGVPNFTGGDVNNPMTWHYNQAGQTG